MIPFNWKNSSLSPYKQNGSSNLLSLRANESCMYTISQFDKALTLERRRAERSRKPFLLMTIDMRDLLQDNYNHCSLANSVMSVINASSREIDLKGWHGSNSVIGTIFTELGETDVHTAQEVIHRKVLSGLHSQLKTAVVKKLIIKFQRFPESSNNNEKICLPDLTLYPDLLEDHSNRKVRLSIKRALDVLASSVALVILTPVMLIIAAVIKLTSEGPVFFKQERIGQFGKKFLMLKFRSMYVQNDQTIHKQYVEKLISGSSSDCSCDQKEDNVFKIKRDPRVTSIGRFIRKTSLDEVPQFWNVLRGEMSLVGPRPPLQYELNCYDIWHRRRILEMKPGITGLWQVTGRSTTTFDEMVRLDLRYTKEWSLWMDIKLLLLTPWVVITCKGGY